MIYQSKSTGFSLLELLAVIVIVGILSSVAYPSYLDNVRTAKRSDAIAELQGILAAQERYFLANKEYATALSSLGFDSDTISIDEYDITAANCSAPNDDETLCIEITAAASTDSQKKDGDIVMNSIGRSELVEAGTDTVKKQL
ncbi:MAG: type IV pilin protein [Pseudomonadota bacterium]|nr:type IV pilin protein [Pseudomonadota bacterium]MEE2748619.1 type IV pilin protein [Pseudomonadota bacterium]